jgi:hypothetical protein
MTVVPIEVGSHKVVDWMFSQPKQFVEQFTNPGNHWRL